MNRAEIISRTRRLTRERRRLSKALASLIVKTARPHMSDFTDWNTGSGMMGVFTKHKDNTLRGTWDGARYYPWPRHLQANAETHEFCGVTEEGGVITFINNLCWIPQDMESMEPEQLIRVLDVTEKVAKRNGFADMVKEAAWQKANKR